MQLPEVDIEYLSSRGLPYEARLDGGMICLVIKNWPLPPGYDRTSADLLLRLATGYPDVPPDMWWFDPAVRLASGGSAPATDVVERYLARNWQRWSRHFDQGRWKAGVDCLETFLALIRADLSRSASPKAA